MATIYRCDRCGAEQYGPLEFIKTRNFYLGELCDECLEKLKLWLKGK